MKTFLRSASTLRNQHNSFFLGLIFGLLIGLAIALAVAFYIKQAPKPFIYDKSTRNKNDYLDKYKNDTDINQGLIGTQPVLPQSPSNKTSVHSRKKSYNLGEPKILEVSSDEIDEFEQNFTVNMNRKKEEIINKSNIPFTSDPSASKNSSIQQKQNDPIVKIEYFLQIGAFRKKEDAEKQRAEVALTGIEVNSIEDKSPDGFYRVRLGPFDENNLMIQKSNLEQAQIQYIVIRLSKKL